MTGLWFGIVCALCWAGLDAVRKGLASKAPPVGLAFFLLVGQLPFLGCWALVDQKWIVGGRYWAPALGSMAMNAWANVLFMRSVRYSALSRTVPFLSLTPVFSAIVAIPLLSELPKAMHWAGVLLVVTATLVLNSDLQGAGWKSVAHDKGARYMVAVAALWAFSIVLDKRALPYASAASHAFILSVGSAAMLFFWLLLQQRLSELSEVLSSPPGLLALMIGFAVAAVAFQMLALQWLWVSVVETFKRAFGVLGSVVLGRLCFHEPVTMQKVVASLLIIVGTGLLATA